MADIATPGAGPKLPVELSYTLGGDKVVLKASAKGQGAHTFALRMYNLKLQDQRSEPAASQWTAGIVSRKEPWIVVVVPDGNFAARKEIVGLPE